MGASRPLIFLDPHPRTEAMVYTPEVADGLAELGRVVCHFGARAPAGLVDDVLPEVAVIIGQTALPAERLERAPLLQAVINVKGNWEPNIDYAGARARGIHVLSAAPAMAPAVAEACLGHAIALGRRTMEAAAAFRAGAEAYGIDGADDAYSLHDAPVGLVGFGNLGRELVPLLRPFGCRIAAHDPWLPASYMARHGAHAASLESVLAGSRFLFILAGATTENAGFLDRAALQLIARDAAVILASRAEVVDFDAFIELAGAGRFRAAVDVFPEEPVPPEAGWRSCPHILFTAHRAGAVWHSYSRLRSMMMDDIRQVLAGHPPVMLQRAEPQQAAMMRSR